ncbi:MAG: flavin reductase family protein [Treponema sp.]|jgi:flavin reductase (DIM6/NTAB) family NADH-FMN oxidoreductase RutF|nr:flavin reductase family protein [Treponema sp.]
MKQQEVIPAGEGWVEINIRHFEGSPSARIGDQWMLISAGDTLSDKSNWNTMTASWGGLGVLWSTDVAFMFIRNSRHTFDFANRSGLFSLSFFDPSHKKALDICGEKSGRDTDKAAAAGLTPVVFADGTVGFKEASQVISCGKLYTHDIDPGRFLDPDIEKHYPQKDYHRMFIGQILTVRTRR